MFNLPEILTLLIGCLLALVFLDGVRRALRIRKSKLKVDLIDSHTQNSTDFEEEWKDYQKHETKEIFSEESNDEDEEIPQLDDLYVIHLRADEEVFSESSISQALVFYNFRIEEKGFFTLLDSNNSPNFCLLNGKNPGTFTNNASSNDIALVLDPTDLSNPMGSFELFVEVAQSLKETFQCELLDQDRNLMTKQMIEHMKYQLHEHQRQFLSSVG